LRALNFGVAGLVVGPAASFVEPRPMRLGKK